MDFPTIFDFEKDFEGSLRCIPKVVRFKLDHCWVKLTLRQWARFSPVERRELVTQPCASGSKIADYGAWLRGLIAARTDEPAQNVALEANAAWGDAGEVPPTQERWARLTPLQRFTLLKLTRDGHDNANFEPALRELGLHPAG